MQVEVRHWDYSFMGHCTSLDLKNHFNEMISDLNVNKILQVSLDSPIVNLNFTEMFKPIMKSSNYSNLLHWQLFPTHNSWRMVHSKWELNQLTGKLRTFSKGALPYFTILLLEEVTIPA